MRIDLILANAKSWRPIVGELKIAADKDPYTGLVQALAAAAQVLSPPQRIRLSEHGERLGRRIASREEEKLVDVYVLLAEFPETGNHRFEQMQHAVVLAARLEEMCEEIGRIKILSLAKDSRGSVSATTRLPQRS